MPEKWADYAIIAVSYDSNSTYIDCVEVRPDLGDKFGRSEHWSRSRVITSIKDGKSFVTAYENTDNKWRRGENVSIVSVRGTQYIRTDRNSSSSDNLGNLPRIQNGGC